MSVLRQGDYDGDGSVDPVPTWDGPEGYTFIVTDDGFVLLDDDPMVFLLLTRGA
jgi:hypothetical protein